MKHYFYQYEQIQLPPAADLPIHTHLFIPEENTPATIPTHWHRSIELTYWYFVEGQLTINNDVYELKPDMITLVNSTDLHSFTVPMTNRKAFLIFLPYDWLKKYIPQIDFYRFQLPEDLIELKKIILKLAELYQSNEPFANIKITELSYSLLHYLCQNCLIESILEHIPPLEKYYSNWIKEVIKYIAANLSNIENVNQIAGHFNYSREHFHRLFEDQTGITPKQFLLDMKLLRAKKALATTDKNIERIAFETGFSDSSTFIRLFKKKCGITPLQYRKKGVVEEYQGIQLS